MTKQYVMSGGRRIEVVDTTDSTVAPKQQRKPKQRKERHIGCPIWWLQCVRNVVFSKDQLIVAIYLWRRRVVCGCDTFDVPNGELQAIGVTRQTKYRALDLLAAAGVIRAGRRSRKAVATVTILAREV